MSNPPSDTKTWLFCVERYRNSEQQHDAEDYFVDGFVMLRFPLPKELDTTALETDMKTLVKTLMDQDNHKELAGSFPKFATLRAEGGLYWFHLMREEHKKRLPTDFHTNSFTEEELLGISDPDEGMPREYWFDRDGDPIEGPPDRLLGLLYG